jgi:ATP-dependent RNA helicase DDX56/DBP9
VQQFNKGLFDFLIATDTSVGVDGAESEGEQEGSGDDSEEGDSDSPDAAAVASGRGGGVGAPQGTKRRRAGDAAARADSDDEDAGGQGVAAEAGVTRGVDFKGVTTVVNVDFPQSVSAYIHRIGRTARGGAAGAALSFVGTVGAADVKVLAAVQGAQPRADNGAPEPSLLPFDRAEVSSFRYRVDGVLRGITRKSVKEARMAELRAEILASQALQAHFEDNPVDLDLLRHDKSLQPADVRPELADIPAYLLPESLRAVVETANGDVGGRRRRKGKKRGRDEGNPKALKTFADQKAADDAVTAGAATADGQHVSSVRQHSSGGVRTVPTSIYGLPSVRRQSDLLLSNRNKWKRDHKLGAWGSGGRKGAIRKKKGARPF